MTVVEAILVVHESLFSDLGVFDGCYYRRVYRLRWLQLHLRLVLDIFIDLHHVFDALNGAVASLCWIVCILHRWRPDIIRCWGMDNWCVSPKVGLKLIVCVCVVEFRIFCWTRILIFILLFILLFILALSDTV